ncbi:MAG: phage major capsid protein [Lachnospiraceae bacterium]|nr:phage major capsid protein [Lachnospiraceae bacterium]
MALQALMLRKRIDESKKTLAGLREKEADFKKREAELEQSIEEAATDEEREAVEAAIGEFETERTEHDESVAGLEKQISDLEENLRSVEQAEEERDARALKERAEAKRAAELEKKEVNRAEQRGDYTNMDSRNLFAKLSVQERDAIFTRDDVKGWIGEIRAHIAEKRELTNVGLTIPDVFLGYLRENVSRYSKLYKHVNVQRVSGQARQTIMGSVPEAIWTECCATLNELSIGFNDVEVDCYKVGGYFKVCNATLEDSDIALASLLIDAIGQAIGLALDKAILYGQNTAANMKMPEGIASRLTQKAKPANYRATARTWQDLHESNIITIPSSANGLALFQKIVTASGAIKHNYARGTKVWAMNEATYTKLQVAAMSINASGAIVSGMNGTMPIIGGVYELLDFIPDNVIIGGYFELYLLAERAGGKFATSEHVYFIQDHTVFKGTARYDGVPVIPEAFVMIGIEGATPTSAMTFAADTANGTGA